MRRTDVVDRISKELKSFVPEAEIILYGSEARGEVCSDSDFDVLILLPDSNDMTSYVAQRSDIFGRLFELSLELDVEISPLILPSNIWNARKTPFSVNVIKDGIRI